MASPIGTLGERIIAPRRICETCSNPSGPKLNLPCLRGPSDLHRSNIIPSGKERELVEAEITAVYSDAVTLEKEIARLQEILEAFQYHRDELYLFENQERGLFSPIRKLPEDVLRQIFLEAHLGRPASYISCNIRNEFPRIITQVCSYWRLVAHSCAPMWSEVRALRYSDKYGATYSELLNKCVIYSNELPLTVQLDETCTLNVLGSNCARVLEQSAHRWKAVSIWNAEFSQAIFACVPCNASFSHLKKLSFYISGHISLRVPELTYLSITGTDTSIHSHCTASLTSAESLVHVVLEKMKNPLKNVVGIPWSQITKFTGRGIYFSPNELLAVLGSMPSLVWLSLDDSDATDSPAEGSVTLPLLKFLYLGSVGEDNALEVLTAPTLRKLSLECDFEYSSVENFVRRSQCRLHEFQITEMGIDDSWESPEFDTIRTFTWQNPIDIEESIEWLTNDNAPSAAENFPQLQRLYILDLQEASCFISQIIRMLESRLHPDESDIYMDDDSTVSGRHLEYICIRFFDRLDEEDISKFQEFIYSETVTNSDVTIKILHDETQSITSQS